MVKYIVNFIIDRAHALNPCLFKAIQGLTGGGELLGNRWCVRAGLFFQFQDERQISLRRILEDFNGGGPIDEAVVGWDEFLLFGLIVVAVDVGYTLTGWGNNFFTVLFFRE